MISERCVIDWNIYMKSWKSGSEDAISTFTVSEKTGVEVSRASCSARGRTSWIGSQIMKVNYK